MRIAGGEGRTRGEHPGKGNEPLLPVKTYGFFEGLVNEVLRGLHWSDGPFPVAVGAFLRDGFCAELVAAARAFEVKHGHDTLLAS